MEAAMTPAVAIRPTQGESEEDFIVRAHHALAGQIPDPAQRNQAVWQAWDSTMGNQMFEQASRYFSAEQYSPTEPRPFFMEHEKVNYGPDGSEQITNYDLAELTKIVRENNHRINDTDAYTALVDKHTLPPPYRDPDPPKNLGFVGPYRLGMMGRKNPRWGIFANEWQRNDKAEQLRDRPNRSVEVLQLKANGRRYIDPIAALSEAPRLPLPTTAQYAAAAADDEAVTVERYDATPAIQAFPGGGNTHIKQFGDKKKGKDMYGSTAPDQDMIREVLNALMSTEEWQTISQAAQMIGDEQPINSGQDVMPPSPEADPMAGGMPEPPMQEPMGEAPMGDPAMGMPPMEGDPSMGMPPVEEEMVEEDEVGPMPPEQNMGKYGLSSMLGAGAKATGDFVGDTLMADDGKKRDDADYTQDKNMAPMLAGAVGSAAGKMMAPDKNAAPLAGAAGGALRGAGNALKGSVKARGKEMAGRVAGDMAKAGATAAATKGKGILARILEGPKEDSAPNQQFGATPGYHRYDSYAEGNMRRDQYAALTAENEKMRSELNQLKAHNDSLLTEQAQMYAATQHEVVQLRQNAIDAERKERLTHLAHQYGAVNLKREMDECLYSNGSEMSNDEFDKRVELIQHYCAVSAPQSPMIPLGYDGSLASGDVQSDKFAAQVADRALALVNDGIKSGNRLTYQDAVAKAKADLTAE